jgi:hypothetical protein
MNLKDNLIRSGLLGIPVVLLYYWNAAADLRFEWVSLPMHIRIWRVRGGCIAQEHYSPVDWLVASLLLFALLSLVTFFFRLVFSKKRPSLAATSD